jgi:uncharacterized protein (TIGR03437 family)
MSKVKSQHLAVIGLACSGIVPWSNAQVQAGPPIVFSANNAADYSTTIAEGSMFVVFGYALGPSALVQVSAFPLPAVLSGTGVSVTSGATILNCPMVYTSDAQIAAVLPSNTPAGPATITVTYNGKTAADGGSIVPITVTTSSVGIFTVTSNGLGSGIFTALDGTLKNFANSAKPGELITAWATGLGPIDGPDSSLPASFQSFPNVQVWVGGQPAQLVYAGRSGCCVAVDQVAFEVPAVGSGCNVPVTIVSGIASSNTVTLPVSSEGGACTNTGPMPPSAILTKAAAGQPVTIAAIGIGPTAIGNRQAFTASLASRLSAALHTRVPVSDAEKLLRAYAAKDPKAMRIAMAKYARQWHDLSRRAKVSLAAQLGQAQEGAAAEFGAFRNEGLAALIGSAQLPVPGSCVILPNSYPSGLHSASGGLDAGASLSLTGAAGSYLLAQTSAVGHYHVLFPASITGSNVPLGSYTISGAGGRDVGAFSAKIVVGSHLSISDKPSLAIVDRSQSLTLAWTGGTAGNYVLIGGYSPHANSAIATTKAYFACSEDAAKGTFTVPSYILSSMNATADAKGIIAITPHPLSNQIMVPGIDLAYFIDGSSDSVNVTFR